jgi:hypothetical protein
VVALLQLTSAMSTRLVVHSECPWPISWLGVFGLDVYPPQRRLSDACWGVADLAAPSGTRRGCQVLQTTRQCALPPPSRGGQTSKKEFTMNLMNPKKIAAGAVIAGALGLPALALGVGVGTASADPGPPCWGPSCQGGDHRGDGQPWRPDQWRPDQNQWRPDQWRPDRGDWDQGSWDRRGIDDARWDHQPFNWQGQRVEPYWDQDRGAWGFWFLGFWIPL